MKKLIITLFLGLLTISSLHAQSEIESAEINFMFVSKDVDGTISGFRSESTIDVNDINNSQFSGSVSVETLKTGNFLRDWSLKGGKYFDEDDHPRIRFESTEVTGHEGGFQVNGQLTIKGTTKDISIEFKRSGNKLIGTTNLYSSDYGIKIKNKREDNLVEVKMILTLGS